MSFPAAIDAHPGWRDLRAAANRREVLEREADEVTARLEEILSRGAATRIWFFYGCDEPVGRVLRTRLDRHFARGVRTDLHGQWFKEVLVYEGRSVAALE